MTSRKTVVVSRFEEPAETVFADRPEHKVSCQLPGNGIGSFPVLVEMNPFGTDAQHELCLSRHGPNEGTSLPTTH